MTTKSINFLGVNDRRGPSPGLWGLASLKFEDVLADPNLGFAIHEDFLGFPVMADATAQGAWITRQDSSCTIQNDPTTVSGVCKLLTDTTDNNEVYLEYGAGKGSFLKFTKGFGKVIYETKVKYSSITDNVMASFIGLTEEGAAAANFIVDGGATMADKDYVGFEIQDDDGDGLNVVHRTASGSRVEVEANTAVPVANTWIKLGIYYDSKESVKFFVNGVETASCDPDDAQFPDSEELVPFWGFKNGGGAAASISIDWFRAMLILDDNDLN